MTVRDDASDDVCEGDAHLSRRAIESLCLVHAVGPTGCTVAEFPGRLGLSPALSSVLARALEPLRDAGWVATSDGYITVTEVGLRALADVLAKVAEGFVRRASP